MNEKSRDHVDEAIALTQIAQEHQDKKFEVAVRVNADVGQSFISRFGIGCFYN